MNCAVVLAAGLSRRMGTQKLLLPLGTTTVIGHVVDRLLDSVIDKVFVVAGHQGNRIAEELSGRGVAVITNSNYRCGMLSSVRCGLRALPRECEAVMVVLGDQPALRTELVDEMVRAFAATDREILVPRCHGKRGHPLLFSSRYCEEILTGHDDLGLRGLLHAHPDDVFELEVSTAAVLSDMDDAEDYRRELARQKRNLDNGFPV